MTESNEHRLCNEEGCDKPCKALGLCQRHWADARHLAHPEARVSYQIRQRYGLPSFPIIPAGWLAAQSHAQNGACAICKAKLADRLDTRVAFSDPLEDGGEATISNLALLCRSCSVARGSVKRYALTHTSSQELPLRAQRVRAGLSLRKMARRLDMSAQYLSDIERGNRTMPANLPAKIQEVLAIIQ